MRTSTRRIAAAAALTLTATLTGACGSGDGEEQGAQETIHATNPRTEHPAGAGARNALSDAECESDKDKWTLTGTLKNSGKEKTVYTVRANVAKIEGGSVEGSKTEEITLDAGADKTVEFKNFYTGGPDGLRCTFSVHAKPA